MSETQILIGVIFFVGLPFLALIDAFMGQPISTVIINCLNFLNKKHQNNE